MSDKNLWQEVLAQIELDVSPANFATWFKNTRVHSLSDDKIMVSVPNSFVKEWLEKKYEKSLLQIIRSRNPQINSVEFTVDRDFNRKRLRPRESQEEQENPEQERLEVFERNERTGLNPRYTFQNLVVGDFNELANAAATAVAENPGQMYNPLFIYGKVGLGKTHILEAIGNKITTDLKRYQVRYTPSERLVSNIISSIQNGTIASLKDNYRKMDVLLVDDVQFLAGKEKTQEEFFHIFNTLYQKGKQIVLSSDRPPKAIPSLAKRLRSRFEGGMITDIGYPDFETRIAILKTKAQERNSELPQRMYEYLAENIKTNVRELEGALNRILLFEKVKNRKVDLDKVKELVDDFASSREQKVTPEEIIETVSKFYNVSKGKLFSSSRKREIVKPRQVAMYLMREKLEFSYPAIAKKFGGKDHTTAIYSCNRVDERLKKNEKLQQDLKTINMQLISV